MNYTDIEIKYTGLRPGGKLFEELNHKTENMVATRVARVEVKKFKLKIGAYGTGIC